MTKKFVLLILFTLFLATITVFAGFDVELSSESVIMGGKLPIRIVLTDSAGKLQTFTLKAKINLGGFDKPDILTKGIKVEGRGEINYLAPKKAGTATITFTAETPDKKIFTKEVKVVVTDKDESEFLSKLKATIDSFKGSVAYKKGGKQVWESIKRDTVLQEGDEILTLEKAYVIVKFPDGSMTRINENTQVLFEKMRQAKDGRILVSIVIKKGGTYNVVQKMVAGSSFEVRTGSVTAGVRGTKFEVSSVDEKPVVKVWEGEVFAFYEDAFVFPVFEGQKIAFELFTSTIEDITQLFQGTMLETLLEKLPSLEEIELPELPEIKLPEIKLPEKPQEPVEEKKVQEPSRPTYEPTVQPKAYIPPLGVETVKKDNERYIVYSISPEFTIGPVTLGIGLTAYSTQVGGTLYYGLPSTEPSTNIINMITINSVALNFGNVYLRYGNMPMMSLGMGFSVRDYFKPYAKSFNVKTSFGPFGMMIHLPYEIAKLWPFEFNQSDSVFAGEVEIKKLILDMDVGISVLYDTQVSTNNVLNNATPVNLSLSSYFRYPLISNLYLGFEISSQVLKDYSAFGLGAFGGLSGRIFSLDIIAGAYARWNGFMPFYFGRTYTAKKFQNKLDSLSQDTGLILGYLAGFNFDTQYAMGRFYLLGDFSGDMDALGELKITIPQVGAVAGLFIYGYYYDATPFAEGAFTDSDTIALLRVTYPIMGQNLVAGMVYLWDFDNRSWIQSVYIGSETSW